MDITMIFDYVQQIYMKVYYTKQIYILFLFWISLLMTYNTYYMFNQKFILYI